MCKSVVSIATSRSRMLWTLIHIQMRMFAAGLLHTSSLQSIAVTCSHAHKGEIVVPHCEAFCAVFS